MCFLVLFFFCFVYRFESRGLQALNKKQTLMLLVVAYVACLSVINSFTFYYDGNSYLYINYTGLQHAMKLKFNTIMHIQIMRFFVLDSILLNIILTSGLIISISIMGGKLIKRGKAPRAGIINNAKRAFRRFIVHIEDTIKVVL